MRVGSGVILFQLAGFLTSALADFYFAKHRCGLFFMDFSLLSTGRAKQKTTRYAGGDKKVIQ